MRVIRSLLLCLVPVSAALAGDPFNLGTPGAALRAPSAERHDAVTVAVIGNLAPVNAATTRYTEEAIRELNLLRPAAVFTVGNFVPGVTRSEQRYGEEMQSVRGQLDHLKMPWYPCPGETDVLPGTRDPSDHRFETLFQKNMGPLYYSVDVGQVHAIILNTEETLDPFAHMLSEQQLTWLRGDLNKTFDRASATTPDTATPQPKYVILFMHRPLWHDQETWEPIHRLLVRFNERPIVSIEGDVPKSPGIGPRVIGVYAAGEGFSKDPARDGIHYTVLGPTSARLEHDASIMIRHVTLLRFDNAGAYPALVQLNQNPAIVSDDIITAPERAVLDKIAAIPNDVLGIAGAIDLSSTDPSKTALVMHVGNPLDVPLDVEFRLASTRNLSSATDRENANPFVENFDEPWQMDSPHQIRHLAPGAKEAWPISLTWNGGGVPAGPPQVEFVVHWRDPHDGMPALTTPTATTSGRICTVILKRRVPVIPQVNIPLSTAPVSLDGPQGWNNAGQGAVYSWSPSPDELQERNPDWEMVADAENIYLRVHVEDGIKSYAPGIRFDPHCGGIAADAVSIAWPSRKTTDSVQRLFIVPFGPSGAELWRNEGMDHSQSVPAPLKGEGEWKKIRTAISSDTGRWTLNVSVPRALLPGNDLRLNIAVYNNNESARTWARTWSPDGSIASFGTVHIHPPESATTHVGQ